MKDFVNKIILGDAFEVIKQIEDNTIDLVLTDPPYFLYKLDQKWSHEDVEKGKLSSGE